MFNGNIVGNYVFTHINKYNINFEAILDYLIGNFFSFSTFVIASILE